MAPNKVTHYIPVMNLSDTMGMLHEGNQLRDVFPVESLKQVQEMFWMDSDDEELMYVYAASVAGRNVSAKTPRVQTCNDAFMDPKDLPENLQPLIEGIAEHIFTREREELAAAIYEYRDVFCSGFEEMGQTDLVTNSIDTREHRPIRDQSRRLPLTKQDVEKAEVQHFLFYRAMSGKLGEPCYFGFQERWLDQVLRGLS